MTSTSTLRHLLFLPLLAVGSAAAAAQQPFDLALQASGGAMLAHSVAIDLRATRTYKALGARMPWSDVVARAGGTVVNRGKVPARVVLAVRPASEPSRARSIRVDGTISRPTVSLLPGGTRLDVGGATMPIWKAYTLKPGERIRLADLRPENPRGVLAMITRRPVEIVVLGAAADGPLSIAVEGFAPLDPVTFSRDLRTIGDLRTGFVPGDQFLPGDQYVPGDQFVPAMSSCPATSSCRRGIEPVDCQCPRHCAGVAVVKAIPTLARCARSCGMTVGGGGARPAV